MNPRLRLPASPLGRVIGLIPDSDRVEFFFSVVLKVRFFFGREKKNRLTFVLLKAAAKLFILLL